MRLPLRIARAGLGLAALFGAPAGAADIAGKPVVGRAERVWIRDADAIVTARIDSGTRTSSLHVETMSIYQRKGRDRVRFTFVDDAGQRHTISRWLKRMGTFKTNGTGTDSRPVVVLGLCIGATYRRTEVNLVDRGERNYALLIGRRFLSNRVLLDTSKRLTVEPRCAETMKKP